MTQKLPIALIALITPFLMTSSVYAKISHIEDTSYLWATQTDELIPAQLDTPNSIYETFGEVYKNDVALAEEGVDNEPIIGEEVEDTIAMKKLGEVPLPDVPLVLNQQVTKWMNYFQGSGRKYFALWLSRSGRYVPMMRQILRENGLPEGLIYLSMIESGFRPSAYSRAKAVGPWQFMKFTGARYGLRANYWIDERMDPEKSTLAAAQHLKDLYDEFDHWYLAAAGYNAGAGKISRAITRYRTDDFWEMTKFRYLKPETKNYVPKLLAASMLASEPEKYGFTGIQYEDPVPYAKVGAPEPVSLDVLAGALSVSLDILKDLNPELRRGVTPPNYPNYELKIPVGMEAKFKEIYPGLERYKAESILVHNVRTGDTVSGIARKYGVSSGSVMRFNNLSAKSKLRRGQEVLIPVDSATEVRVAKAQARPKTYTLASSSVDRQIYIVQDGDTLWKISKKLDVTVSQLREWNKLRKSSSIRPGQKLLIGETKKTVSPTLSSMPWKTYMVQLGDNLWSIAKKLGVPARNLAQWNNLDIASAQLKAGNKLRFRS